VLVPIAPHALSNRPIVLPDSSEIVIEIVRGRDITVNFDMQTLCQPDAARPHPHPALAARDHLPAPGRLELLQHAARKTALERVPVHGREDLTGEHF
jgi:hypothetical protein